MNLEPASHARHSTSWTVAVSPISWAIFMETLGSSLSDLAAYGRKHHKSNRADLVSWLTVDGDADDAGPNFRGKRSVRSSLLRLTRGPGLITPQRALAGAPDSAVFRPTNWSPHHCEFEPQSRVEKLEPNLEPMAQESWNQ
jgi:hypothetical protein